VAGVTRLRCHQRDDDERDKKDLMGISAPFGAIRLKRYQFTENSIKGDVAIAIFTLCTITYFYWSP
jgi:hypothetical protein